MEKKAPKNWQELTALMEYLVDCPVDFFRLDEDEAKYGEWKKRGTREEVLINLNDELGDSEIKILRNNFSYTKILQHLPNVQDWVLWNRKGKLNDKKIREIVNTEFVGKEWCYFERGANHKSVPEIWHCHVFVKN